MKLDIPFFSQHAPEIPEEWRTRSCGVISLYMALIAKHGTDLSGTSAFLTEGLSRGVYVTSIGWKHDGLLDLARDHGVAAYRREFGTRMVSWRMRKLLAPIAHWFAYSGMHALRTALDAGVIPIVSLTTETKDTHLVVLTGYERNGFYYHDPAGDEATHAYRYMDSAMFARRWRQLALFIGA